MGGSLTPAVGQMIKEARQRRGLTQRELAVKAGLSLGAVRDLEQGRSSRPRPQSLEALADALELDRRDRAQLRAFALPGPAQAPPAGVSHIQVLGPLAVLTGGVPVPIGAGRHRIVLARLALTPNRAVSPDELIGLLWPAGAPASASNVVQTHISRLRRLLTPPTRPDGPDGPDLSVELTAGGYRLSTGEHQLDLLAYRSRLARSRLAGHEPQREFELLAEALELWHGELPVEDVAELQGDPLVTGLAHDLVDATNRLARLGEALRRLPEVLPRLRRLAGRHPLHESLQARFILALAASGQQATALDTFDHVRHRLADELGIDPGAELDAARQAVLDNSWDTPRPPAAPSTAAPVPWQAPAPPADFTGRTEHLARLETELQAAARSADGGRLAVGVVSGMAGVGKTALALRAAQRLRPHFPDGQLYVDLRGFDDQPVGVLDALARLLWGLGVPGSRIPADPAGAAALYRSVLAGRRVLIILDNAQNAAQVRLLLPGTGGNAVLVTSRNQCAELEGATLHPLPLLSRDDALQMLAHRIDPARLSANPAAAVRLVEACGLLPLAVRIMAARLAADPDGSLPELLTRLADAGHGLDQFSVGDIAVTASFDLSYRELNPQAAAAFRAAALVPGPSFTVETLAAMLPADTGPTTTTLRRLVADNLVQAGRGRRYRQHDLLRLYGRRRAEVVTGPAGRAAVLRRLFDWYLARTAAAIPFIYAETARLPVDVDTDAPGVRFDTADAARSWLDEELDGLLEAIREAGASSTPRYAWLLADQLRGYFGIKRDGVPWLASAKYGLAAAEAAGDLLGQAAMYQTTGGAQRAVGQHHEAMRSIERGIEAARRSGWLAGEANMTEDLALLNAELGRTDEALSLFHRVLAIAAGPELDGIRAFTYNDLGVLCMDLGRMREAADYFTSALEINRTEARRPSGMKNRLNLGIAQRQLGRLVAGQENLETALGYFRETGSQHGQMATLDELSQLRAQLSQWRPAVEYGTEAVVLAEQLRDPLSQAAVLNTLGFALLGSGAAGQALDQFQHALRLAQDGGYQYYEAQAEIGIAETLLATGEPARAAESASAALVIVRGRYRILEGDALVQLARATAALGDESTAAQHGAEARAIFEAEGTPAKLASVDKILGSGP